MITIIIRLGRATRDGLKFLGVLRETIRGKILASVSAIDSSVPPLEHYEMNHLILISLVGKVSFSIAIPDGVNVSSRVIDIMIVIRIFYVLFQFAHLLTTIVLYYYSLTPTANTQRIKQRCSHAISHEQSPVRVPKPSNAARTKLFPASALKQKWKPRPSPNFVRVSAAKRKLRKPLNIPPRKNSPRCGSGLKFQRLWLHPCVSFRLLRMSCLCLMLIVHMAHCQITWRFRRGNFLGSARLVRCLIWSAGRSAVPRKQPSLDKGKRNVMSIFY